jgi:hypothetical protein
MTATGTLYIDETCRDEFKEQLDEWYGKDKWRLDGSEHGTWDMANFPAVIEVKVYDDETDASIGLVQITSRFEVAGDMERYVECYPDKIKRLDLEGEKMNRENLRILAEKKGLKNPTLFLNFMNERFPKEAHETYVNEWIERFLTGNPLPYMDPTTKAAYIKVINEYRGEE